MRKAFFALEFSLLFSKKNETRQTTQRVLISSLALSLQPTGTEAGDGDGDGEEAAVLGLATRLTEGAGEATAGLGLAAGAAGGEGAFGGDGALFSIGDTGVAPPPPEKNGPLKAPPVALSTGVKTFAFSPPNTQLNGPPTNGKPENCARARARRGAGGAEEAAGWRGPTRPGRSASGAAAAGEGAAAPPPTPRSGAARAGAGAAAAPPAAFFCFLCLVSSFLSDALSFLVSLSACCRLRRRGCTRTGAGEAAAGAAAAAAPSARGAGDGAWVSSGEGEGGETAAAAANDGGCWIAGEGAPASPKGSTVVEGGTEKGKVLEGPPKTKANGLKPNPGTPAPANACRSARREPWCSFEDEGDAAACSRRVFSERSDAVFFCC